MTSDLPLRTAGLALGAVIVLATGVWLTLADRPYSNVLVSVHKLVDLAGIAVLGFAVYQAHRAAPLAGPAWALIAATAATLIALLATGGALSAMAAPPSAVLWAHRIGGWAVAALGVACVRMLGR